MPPTQPDSPEFVDFMSESRQRQDSGESFNPFEEKRRPYSPPPLYNKVGGMFDFGFTKFITPSLVKGLYFLNILFVLVADVYIIVFLARQLKESPEVLPSVGILVGAAFASLFWILAVRLSCEGVLILFKIEEHLRTKR